MKDKLTKKKPIKTKTTWEIEYKFIPIPGWGIWTETFYGTIEEFNEMLKDTGRKAIAFRKRHWSPIFIEN